MSDYFKDSQIAPEVEIYTENLPNEFQPVQPFVQKCLELTTKEGLNILGRRGGYIYTNQLTPNKDSIYFNKNSILMPYWYFMSSQDNCKENCQFNSKQLPLRNEKSIEKELERYVTENIENCLDNFESLESLNFEISIKDKPIVDITIAENDLVTQLTYPITITRNNNKHDAESFYSTLDIDLDDIYDMASYIKDLEIEYHFLERHTLNIIDAFSSKDENKLPPRSDAAFEFSSTNWKKSQVRHNLRQLLTSYIPLLRLQNSLNWKEIDVGNEYQNKLYNYGMAVPNNKTGLEVTFHYFDFWEMYFNLNCNGEVCEPESFFNDIIPINFGIMRYHFAYDISYPVMVEIHDPSAFNDQGYTFTYMLESNLRNNEPLTPNFKPLFPTGDYESTMLCDENKRNSGDITIEVYDTSRNPLKDVDIFYSCIESCYIGKIQDTLIETKLPVCLGGTLTLRKQGFNPEHIQLSTEFNKPDHARIELSLIKEIDIELKKKVLRKGQEWIYTDEIIPLEENDIATITIKSPTSTDLLEIRHDSSEKATISQDTYEVTIMLITEQELFVPEEVRKIEDQTFLIDSVNLTEFVSGMTTYEYTFSEEDLNKDKLTFYVWYADMLDIPLSSRRVEDLNIFTQFQDLTNQYYRELTPR